MIRLALNVRFDPELRLSPPAIGYKMVVWSVVIGALTFVGGCGTTRENQATEQLLLSDAVDRSISSIDFRPLSGSRVYLDTTYLQAIKAPTFVNAEYVTSSLRQQIMAAGCLMQDKIEDAEIIIEPRCGTLGSDDHRVTYGIPENNALGSASNFLPNAPAIPPIPELAFARRDARESAAKLAVFAYDRETRHPVWQSGISESRSTARDTWFMGVGPFQAGTIRENEGRGRLAGSKMTRFGRKSTSSPPENYNRPPVDFTAETRFEEGWPVFNRQGGGSRDMLPNEGALPQPGLLPGDPVPEIIATGDDEGMLR